MNFKPNCMGTAIGSLPHTTAEKAVDVVLANIPDAPIWPQLPKLGLREQMEIQYSEGMPAQVLDEAKGRMYFNTAADSSEAFAQFYESYMTAMDPDSGNGDCSSMAITPTFSKGIYALENRLKASGKKLPCVKVQTTGPISFSLTLVDENKRAIYYNDEFRDMIVKALAMKCRWQIQKFKSFADNIICFVDEPILSAFGSSTYVSVQRADVVQYLKEMVDAIHTDGAIAGIHCCGNTEWSIPVDAEMDLINFDAFQYGDTLGMYPEAMTKHLRRGGILAWGIVPTSAVVREQTAEGLMAKMEGLLQGLSTKVGMDTKTILTQSMITPSCGTGSLPEPDAEKVFSLIGQVSRLFRSRYAFA